MTILSFNIFRTCPYWTCTICAAPGDGFWALCSLLTALSLT